MSGQYRLVGTLTEAQADLFYEFGFSLNILLDVSHAIHVRTIRADRPKDPIITKPIELDCQMEKFGTTQKYTSFLKACLALGAASPLYNFGKQLQTEGAKVDLPPNKQLEAVIGKSKIKLEFPDFDTSIAALDQLVAGTEAANAVLAARAANEDAFDALLPAVRSSMGMFVRKNNLQFKRHGAAEGAPRTAYRS